MMPGGAGHAAVPVELARYRPRTAMMRGGAGHAGAPLAPGALATMVSTS